MGSTGYRTPVVGALVLGILSLSGCATDMTESQQAITTTSALPGPNEVRTASPSAPRSAPSSPRRNPAVRASDLQLGEEDLLDGRWKPTDDASPDATAGQESTAPECLRQSETLKTPDLTDSAAAGWRWSSSTAPDTIHNASYVFRSKEAASAAFTSYESRVRACTSWVTSGSFREQQRTFPIQLGQESFGRIVETSDVEDRVPSGGRQYWGVSLVGNVIVEVSYYPGPLLDTTTGTARTVQLLTRAVGKAQL